MQLIQEKKKDEETEEKKKSNMWTDREEKLYEWNLLRIWDLPERRIRIHKSECKIEKKKQKSPESIY